MNSSVNSRGFTLVEVVVALAIVVVAFLAMYGSVQQMVASTTLLQEKTIGSWIAFDQITQLRIGGEFPDADKREGEIEMAGSNWLYSIEFSDTASADVKQVIVRVSPESDPDNQIGLATGALLRPLAPAGQPNTQQKISNFGDSGARLRAAGATDPSVQNIPITDETVEGVLE